MQTLELSLSLLLPISASAAGAAEAISLNLVGLFCDNQYGNFFAASRDPYVSTESPSGILLDRTHNAWHRAWCTMLQITVSLLESAPQSSALRKQVIGFIGNHRARLSDALDLSARPVRLEGLVETQRVVELFCKVFTSFPSEWLRESGQVTAHYQGYVHLSNNGWWSLYIYIYIYIYINITTK